MRILLLVHMVLGIVGSALMVMWCASGIVMVYVPYPKVTEVERRHGLAPIAWEGCCEPLPEAMGAAGVVEAQVEMLAERLVLRAPGGAGLVNLRTGQRIALVDESEARSVAASFATLARGTPERAAVPLLDVVVDDVWTVGGVARSERPLYRFAIADDAGTQVYVSSISGKVVQATTRRDRFWSWLGAIPHWLYFTALRRQVGVWSRTVIYASLVGCLLALTGLAAGVGQLVRGVRCGRLRTWSWHRWHHMAGLAFGVFVLTWVTSGFLSMNPWGLLESAGAHAGDRLRSSLPPAARVVGALRGFAHVPAASGAVRVRMASFESELSFVVERSDGTRAHFDELGHLAPLSPSDIVRVARRLAGSDPIESVELLGAEDAYYFGPPGAPAALPVWRIVFGDAQNRRYYLDAVSGELLAEVDRGAREYRWLHQALHRLDAWPVLRRRPLWDAVIVPLALGALGVCATGLYIGMRRVTRAKVRGQSKGPVRSNARRRR